MKITRAGRVADRIILLGRPESCIYLVDGGEEWAILGGGMTYTIPDVLWGLGEFGPPPSKISRLIIHHTHFDHVGLVPYLTTRFPWIKVIASQRGQAQLARPEVAQKIAELNQLLLTDHGLENHSSAWGLNGLPMAVDRAAADGERIVLGDLTLEFLDVPGHSSCSLAVYIPEIKALFASDAGGVPYGDIIFTAANSNFDLYQASLEKMAALDVDIFLAEHYGALTGEDGRGHLARSIDAAEKDRGLLEESLTRTRNPVRTAEEMTERFRRNTRPMFLPESVVLMVMEQMARFIWREMS